MASDILDHNLKNIGDDYYTNKILTEDYLMDAKSLYQNIIEQTNMNTNNNIFSDINYQMIMGIINSYTKSTFEDSIKELVKVFGKLQNTLK